MPVVLPRFRPQRRRLRVTTGCRTCRARHVKCDEQKPVCRNCGRKGRFCLYDDTPTARNEPDGSPRNSQAEQISGPSGDSVPRLGEHEPSDFGAPLVTQQSNVSGHSHGQFSAVSESGPSEVRLLLSPGEDVTGDGCPNFQLPCSSPEGTCPSASNLGSILLHAGFKPSRAGVPPLDSSFHAASTTAGRYLSSIASRPSIPVLRVPNQIQLDGIEVAIFRNYVEIISNWIDSFSHDHPFHTVVPILALQCPPLMNSCLALSAKQMSLMGTKLPFETGQHIAVDCYRKALKSISTLLVHPEYAQSDEVLAACIILSTYEMMNVTGENLGSHLKGVSYLLQSQNIKGSFSGIRGASYWTWYRHEIWAALQAGRRMSLDESYWMPPPLTTFGELKVEEITNRVIFIFGQCINFGTGNDRDSNSTESLQNRDEIAQKLDMALDDWKEKLPPAMTCLFVDASSPSVSQDPCRIEFPYLWFVFPQSATAHQVYHAAKILLALNRPSTPPKNRSLTQLESLATRRSIEKSREQVFLVANSEVPDPCSLLSTQCLYIAGLVTEGVQERRRTLELIENCQIRSGRQTLILVKELCKAWGSDEGFAS